MEASHRLAAHHLTMTMTMDDSNRPTVHESDRLGILVPTRFHHWIASLTAIAPVLVAMVKTSLGGTCGDPDEPADDPAPLDDERLELDGDPCCDDSESSESLMSPH